MKIAINNLDLSYTIDTYGMFTGDSYEESEFEYYTDTYNLNEKEVEKIEFDYDHKNIVDDLAHQSIQLLHENLVQHNSDGVVLDIDYSKSQYPRFYNYTTDSYIADWTIDEDKLIAYINKHNHEFAQHIVDEWQIIVNIPQAIDKSFLDDDTIVIAMIDFYTRNVYDREEYEDSMFECESEVYSNNISPSEDFQKILDAKEAIKYEH